MNIEEPALSTYPPEGQDQNENPSPPKRAKSNLVSHAESELKLAGYNPRDKEDGPNKWMAQNVLELMRVFAKQGHSGTSAPYCVSLFKKLARYEPLGPLTGEDNEWVEVAQELWQNKRCSHVFKEARKDQPMISMV
jgi:hypothetical protein